MIKLFFFTIILSATFSVNASQYQQVVHAESSVWIIANKELPGASINTIYAGEQVGDHIPIWFSAPGPISENPLLLGTVKSSNDFAQLWFKESSNMSLVDSPEYILVYDIDLDIGDTFHYPNYSFIVDSVYFLNNRKHIVFNDELSNWHTKIKFIEGVGPNTSVVFYYAGFFLNPYVVCGYHDLNLFYETNHSEFENCDFKSTGLQTNIESKVLTFFPNPATGSTTINLPEEITNPSVAVYDLQGRKVLTQDLYQNENVLSLKSLTKGVYIITVKSESQVLMIDKLVVF